MAAAVEPGRRAVLDSAVLVGDAEPSEAGRHHRATRAERRLLHRLEDECLAGRIGVAQRGHPASRIGSTGRSAPAGRCSSGCGRARIRLAIITWTEKPCCRRRRRLTPTPIARTPNQAALISQPDCPPSLLAGALLGGDRCSAIVAGERLGRRMFRFGMPGDAGDRVPSLCFWTMRSAGADLNSGAFNHPSSSP